MRANNETPTLVTTALIPLHCSLSLWVGPSKWPGLLRCHKPICQTMVSTHCLKIKRTNLLPLSLRLKLFTRGFLARSWLIWCKTDVMIHANTFPPCPAWVCWADFVTCNDFVYLNSSAIRSNTRKHCGQYQMISSSPPLYLSSLNKRQQMTCVKFN